MRETTAAEQMQIKALREMVSTDAGALLVLAVFQRRPQGIINERVRELLEATDA